MVSKGSKQHVSLQAVEPARVEAPEGGLTRGPVPPAPQDCHPGSLPRQTKHYHTQAIQIIIYKKKLS